MSREIKFRAWDTVAHKMIPSVSVYGHTMGTSVLVNFRHSELSYAPGENWKRDDFGNHYADSVTVVPLQYTNLKDKNGVEIYEGDIVWRYGLLHVVEWNQKVCAFGLVLAAYYGKGDAIGGIAQYTDSPIKVIGNVYENPELLEPKS